MEVAIRAEKGPNPPALINLRGNINKFTMKIPSGGIHADRKMEAICMYPLHTY